MTADLAAGQVIRLADGRNAIIRFVGETAFAPGVWVGVELDDGTGKNDGSVQGERYFDCDMGNGMFVRPAAVAVIAQPPPKPKPAPIATRKTSTSRPNSMFTTGSRTASTSLDTGVGRRKSLNAPSPSPGPRTSRPSSIARVRTQCSASCTPLPAYSNMELNSSLLRSLLRNSSEPPRQARRPPEPAPRRMLEGLRPPKPEPLQLRQGHLWALLLFPLPEQAVKRQSHLQGLPGLPQHGLQAVDYL